MRTIKITCVYLVKVDTDDEKDSNVEAIKKIESSKSIFEYCQSITFEAKHHPVDWLKPKLYEQAIEELEEE